MPREPRNIGASVRARLLERARAERSDFQILLTRYALERLLYRLSASPHRDRFILKGAMLFVTWVDDPFRPTRDLDLLGHGDSDAVSIAETFRAICAQPVADDGVTFEIAALTAAPIREEVEYGGVRVRTTATIAGARIPIQVDIGFGDAVTPGAVEIDYPALLDAPTPHLRAYLEKVTDLYAGRRFWPEPMLQLNPHYEGGGLIQSLVGPGGLIDDCAQIFRDSRAAADDVGAAVIEYSSTVWG